MQLLVIAEATSGNNDVVARLAAAQVGIRLATPALPVATLAEMAETADGVLVDCADLPGQALPLLRALRDTGLRLPLLLLVPGPAAGVESEAFNLGADAVLARSVPVPSLLARLAAIGRRAPVRKSTLLRCGNVTLDRAAGVLSVDGAPVDLTRCELGVLDLLMAARGAILDKDRICEALHEEGAEGAAGVLRVFVYRLRRKLAARGADDIIRTVWGVGYRVEAPSVAPAVPHRPGMPVAAFTSAHL